MDDDFGVVCKSSSPNQNHENFLLSFIILHLDLGCTC